MTDGSEFNDLVLRIYDAALDVRSWSSTLTQVARYIGARGAFIFELEGQAASRRIEAPYFSETYDALLVRQYLDRHHEQELLDQDIFTTCSRRSDAIELIPDTVLAPSRTELFKRPNVQEMRGYHIGHRAAALLDKDQISRDRFGVQFSTLSESISQEQFRRAAQVMPHIAKSLNVSRPLTQLAEVHASIERSLDLLLVGICILDARGMVVTSNAEFRAQMERYQVFRRDPRGRLLMRSQENARQFTRLTIDQHQHGHFGGRPRKEAIVALVDDAEHTLCVEIAPLQNASPFDERNLLGHIVYSMDTSKGFAIDEAIMGPLFSLTRSESQVLQLMAEGLTNPQISDRRGRSLETINSQVKAVLEKTRSANRTQAIRLAANVSSSFLIAEPERVEVEPARTTVMSDAKS